MKISEFLKLGLEKLGPNGENWYDRKRGDYPDNGMECFTTILVKTDPNIGEDYLRTVEFVKESFGNKDNFIPVWDWNDATERTFDDIRNKYEELIAKAEAMGD